MRPFRALLLLVTFALPVFSEPVAISTATAEAPVKKRRYRIGDSEVPRSGLFERIEAVLPVGLLFFLGFGKVRLEGDAGPARVRVEN